MLNRKMKPVAAAIGTAFVASLATVSVANADEALFQADELDQGYDLLAGAHGDEGKCGEGQCGEGDEGEGDEGKCGEGQCGEGEGDEGKCGEGQCGEGEGDEGKCGEGQCGGAA